MKDVRYLHLEQFCAVFLPLFVLLPQKYGFSDPERRYPLRKTTASQSHPKPQQKRTPIRAQNLITRCVTTRIILIRACGGFSVAVIRGSREMHVAKIIPDKRLRKKGSSRTEITSVLPRTRGGEGVAVIHARRKLNRGRRKNCIRPRPRSRKTEMGTVIWNLIERARAEGLFSCVGCLVF